MAESRSGGVWGSEESFMEYVLRVLEFINKAAGNALSACKSGSFESCDFALAQLQAAVIDLRAKLNMAREKGYVRFREF